MRIPQLARFGAVGLAATAVHALIYTLAVEPLAVPAMTANVLGFACAFSLSFYGHRYWTFPHDGSLSPAALRASGIRFFVTALLGLASNSAITWLLVERLRQPPRSALAGILFVTPALVFAGSKWWAFAHPPAAPQTPPADPRS